MVSLLLPLVHSIPGFLQVPAVHLTECLLVVYGWFSFLSNPAHLELFQKEVEGQHAIHRHFACQELYPKCKERQTG